MKQSFAILSVDVGMAAKNNGRRTEKYISGGMGVGVVSYLLPLAPTRHFEFGSRSLRDMKRGEERRGCAPAEDSVD